MDFISLVRKEQFNNQRRRFKVNPLQRALLLLVASVGIYSLLWFFGSMRIDEELLIEIPEGHSVSQTAELLNEHGLIRSSTSLMVSNKINPLVVKSGMYQFIPGVYNLKEIRERISEADYGDIYVSVTIPEGATRIQMAEVLGNSKLIIDQEEFLRITEGKEGYLFPDTYFFLPSDTEKEVADRLVDNFENKIEELREQYASERSFEDIIIMASIIEKEATSNLEEMRMVSGILWKRIDEGMLLQVDAPFLYIDGKTSEQLRINDLRTDGPYNTYTNLGLTPGPIANPGEDALRAALDPLDSLYYFYLHDTTGKIHYGITHDDHVNNKNRYLR